MFDIIARDNTFITGCIIIIEIQIESIHMSSLTTLQQLQPQVFDGIQVEIPSSEAGQIQTRHNETPKMIWCNES